jgi:hypothetical protein
VSAIHLQTFADQEAMWRGLRAPLERRQRPLRDRPHGQVDDEREIL